MALSLRRERFVSAYLLEPNATQAAIAAGYSPKSAQVNASRLMAEPEIVAAIAERAGKALRKVDSSVERIVTELAAIGFADVTAIFADSPGGPRLKPIGEWPPEIRVCIASIKTSRRVIDSTMRKVKDPDEGEDQLVNETEAEIVTEIKLWPKVEALRLLAQYRKMVGTDQAPLDQRPQFVGLQIVVNGPTAVQVNVSGDGLGDGIKAPNA